MLPAPAGEMLTAWRADSGLDLVDSIAPFDFHTVASYLRSPAVAATIAPYLGATA